MALRVLDNGVGVCSRPNMINFCCWPGVELVRSIENTAVCLNSCVCAVASVASVAVSDLAYSRGS